MKKRISFLSLIVATSLILATIVSCGKQQVGGDNVGGKKFEVVELKIWGKDVTKKVDGQSLSVSGKDSPKAVEVLVSNCDEYNVDVVFLGKKLSEPALGGMGKVVLEDVPTKAESIIIKLSAPGMEDEKKILKLSLSSSDAEDLKVVCKGKQATGNEAIPINTTESNETITISTTDSQMTKVTVAGNNVDLSADGKSATYNLAVTGTDASPQEVVVNVEFRYFNKVERKFKVKKYTNTNDFPLELVSAKLMTTDDNEDIEALTFDSTKKATSTLKIKDIRHSTVKLVMEFDQDLKSREVKKCTDQRADSYEDIFNSEAASGTFSGYITHDVNIKGEEIELNPISGKTYTEILIVGYGTVSYEIEVESNTSKKAVYTVEIVNPTKTFSADGKKLPSANFMKDVGVYNGHSGRPTFFGIADSNSFFLPFYYKGTNFNADGNLAAKDNFTDLLYMENFSMVLIHRGATEPFYFYYNVMNGENSKAKNEHKFKRLSSVKGTDNEGKPIFRTVFSVADMNDKYFDCFMSAKGTLPNPMISYLYNKKWKKANNRHGWLLKLRNNKKGTWYNDSIPSQVLFDLIFNYRVQTKSYDEQNATSGGDKKYLTIAKDQKFTYWESAQEIQGWTPFLSGETGDNKDKFILEPTFINTDDIAEVKYSIQCGDTADGCVAVNEYQDVVVQPSKDNGFSFYKLGGKTSEIEPTYEFVNGKVYKIEVTVKYKTEESNTDVFRYIIDYKNQQTLNIMDLADEYDVSSNLFGVPTSYGVKMLDSSVIKEMVKNRYTAHSAM